jgi:hypothetical protein
MTMLYRSAADAPPDLALTKDELKQNRARLGGCLTRVNDLPYSSEDGCLAVFSSL